MKTETPSKLQCFWESHVNAWEETHLSQAAYCQKNELQTENLHLVKQLAELLQ